MVAGSSLILRRKIKSSIALLNEHGSHLRDITHHVPHLPEWQPDSDEPRPGMWSDIKHLIRRHKFLHRKQFRHLISTFRSQYQAFADIASTLLQEGTHDLARLERLTWTYAQLAQHMDQALTEAKESKQWSRKQLGRKFCDAANLILQVLGRWMRDVEASKGEVYKMIENKHLEHLSREFESVVAETDPRLRQIAVVWRKECVNGQVSWKGLRRSSDANYTTQWVCPADPSTPEAQSAWRADVID